MQPRSKEARRQKFLWTLTCWAAAALIATVAFGAMVVSDAWTLLQAVFAAGFVFLVTGAVFLLLFNRDLPPPKIQAQAAATPRAVHPEPAPEPTGASEPAPAPDAAQTPAASAPADPKEDLQRIRGIGPKLAMVLVEKGVGGVAQIAGWRDEDVAWWDENLEGLKGRASRDDWVAQARELVAADSAGTTPAGGDAARNG